MRRRTHQITLSLLLALVLPISILAQAVCDKSASITVAAGVTGQLVSLVAGRTIDVCGFAISGDTAATGAQFQTGTGTTCGTGTVNLTGVMLMVDNGNIVLGSGSGTVFKSTNNAAICLAATTGAVTGVLIYQQ